MLRISISPLILLSLISLITACSGGSEPTANTSPAANNSSTVVADNNASNSTLLQDKFNTDINKPILQSACIACHTSAGVASGTRLLLETGADNNTASLNSKRLTAFPNSELLLNKAANQVAHFGASTIVLATNSAEYQHLNNFLTSNTYFTNSTGATSNNGATPAENTSTTPPTVPSTPPPVSQGELIYTQQCAACHGADGKGGSSIDIVGGLNRTDLVNYVDINMPFGSPANCDLNCSETVSAWMLANLLASNTSNKTTDGGTLYSQQCAACHGAEGNGGSSIAITAALNRSDLTDYIKNTMPWEAASNCDINCATAIANWMKINLQAPVVANGDGGALYNQQCAYCHGADGNGGSSVAITAALNRPDLNEYIVNTMPYGSPGRCDTNCTNDITTWMLATFKSTGNNTPIDIPVINVAATLSTVPVNEARDLLYKTSLNLVGRVPNEAEYNLINTQGSTALPGIVDAQLKEDAFVERIKNIFNDLLLTQQWDKRSNFHSYMLDYSLNSFDNGNADWITADDTIPYYNTIRRYVSNGHSRSPLELIAYIIKNNRPFSEILTADYAMLNWYSAKSFGLENSATFRDLPVEQQLNKNFPKDPADFQAIQLPKVPSAGILTTGVYMFKYRTTTSNRNRNRAYTLLKTFLDTDIFGIGGERPGDSNSSFAQPTLSDPNCVACHSVMDPVASAYKHWMSVSGEGRPFYNATPSSNEWNPNNILSAGFNGKIAPANEAPLPWLAKQITQDPRFARAMVKAVFQQITGVKLIPATTDSIVFQSTPYLQQQAFIGAVAEQFIKDSFNFKNMIKNLAISNYAMGKHSSPLADLMMTPKQLNQKIQATLGQSWDNWLDTWNVLYGGIDSNSVIVRNQNPNGTTATIQLRMAEDMACKVTAKEFSIAPSQRLLLGNTEPYILPNNTSNINRIKQTLVDIYARLIGIQLSINDPTITSAYEVYNSALTLGQAGITDGSIAHKIASDCAVTLSSNLYNANYINNDNNYYTRAWQAVIQFALMDPRYFYP